MIRWIKVGILILAIAGLMALLRGLARGEEPNTYILQDYNLRSAEDVLAVAGHQVRCFDGRAVGTAAQRQNGTALIAVRGRDLRGKWFIYILQAEEGAIKKIKVYPLPRPPADWKGE
jgi:hypothetical protein